MRWNVVSMPGGGSAAKKSEKGVREYTGPASNANEALDRVTIPQDALDRISELMSPGASLIISGSGSRPRDRHRHRLHRADALTRMAPNHVTSSE